MAKRTAPDPNPRGWAPTARDAVVACTPVASLVTALGLGGTGYLTGRPDVAACGAVVGSVGMYVERFQRRDLRQRFRRERARFRLETRDLHATVDELRREIAAVRLAVEERASQPVQAVLSAHSGEPAPASHDAVPAFIPEPVRERALQPVREPVREPFREPVPALGRPVPVEPAVPAAPWIFEPAAHASAGQPDLARYSDLMRRAPAAAQATAPAAEHVSLFEPAVRVAEQQWVHEPPVPAATPRPWTRRPAPVAPAGGGLTGFVLAPAPASPLVTVGAHAGPGYAPDAPSTGPLLVITRGR